MMKTLLLLALSLSAQALSLGNSLDSCEGRCGYGTDSSSSCQCNPACQRFGDCCADYQSVCTGASSALPITDAELLSVAELLFALDENKASPALLVISPQALVSSSQTNTQQDLSPGPWPVCLSEGEIKKGKVSGFHNWVQFYLLEKEGLLNYYSHNFDGPWTGYPDVLGMQFNWDGYFKQVGSALIGSSPEFDLALYTLCYIARPGKQ
nr:PREDICTED: poly(U)-specific endoribonuclease-like [Lepisosteus oculatus]